MGPLQVKEWQTLLREIHAAQVVPIIGPGLVSLQQENARQYCNLYAYLAPQLAQALGLPNPDRHTGLTTVIRSYLRRGGQRADIYHEIRAVLEDCHHSPPPPLLDLASITDFNLYVSCTFDQFLVKALKQIQLGFHPQKNVLRYHPEKPVDIPSSVTSPLVYYLFGDYQTYPYFAIWDEDYLEFLYGLMNHISILRNLFHTLKNKSLLILGVPYEDWLVRFFLRIVKQCRLSEQRHECMTYLADCENNIGEPLVFFFDRLKNATRVIHTDPGDFVAELKERWEDTYSMTNDASSFLRAMPETMESHAIFISYAKEDLETAVTLAMALAKANLPVWLDKGRLRGGQDFDMRLQYAVKQGCSFFVSLISRETEKTRERYVHQERQWAAEAHVPSFVYYIPVIIDKTIEKPTLEPECFSGIHPERLTDDPGSWQDVVRRIKDCFDAYQQSSFTQRPRSF